MDLSQWGWPQFVYASLIIFGLGVTLAKHGQPREPHNFMFATITTLLCLWIQYKGGFWK